jgi:hypothetical protein
MLIAIGDTIPFSELKALDSDQIVVNYLRLNTYLLSVKVPEKTLGKYMGREQAKAYLATHSTNE